MRLVISRVLILFILFGCSDNKQNKVGDQKKSSTSKEKTWEVISSKEWAKSTGLLNAESIIFDQSSEVFYVTNGKDYKPGIEGFISKISKTGEMISLKWVANLNRPTGMAIKDNVLYVADVNSLLAINTKNGKILDKYSEPIPNSGLNDVTVNDKGDVYASASFVHSVFKLNNNKLEVWIKDGEKLKWANGLAADKNKILVAGLSLNAIDINSKQITTRPLPSTVKDFDGIVSDGQGGYFLTTVDNSALFHLGTENQVKKIMREDVYFADLTFKENTLYIPRGNRKNNEFFITVMTLELK